MIGKTEACRTVFPQRQVGRLPTQLKCSARASTSVALKMMKVRSSRLPSERARVTKGPLRLEPARDRVTTIKFSAVLVSVMSLTLVSLTVSVLMAVAYPDPSDEVRRIIETCSTTWKLGFGAIVGLLGGRVAH